MLEALLRERQELLASLSAMTEDAADFDESKFDAEHAKLKELDAKIEAARSKAQRAEAAREALKTRSVPAEPKTPKWRSFGEFAESVIAAAGGSVDQRLEMNILKDRSSGYAVPVEFSRRISAAMNTTEPSAGQTLVPVGMDASRPSPIHGPMPAEQTAFGRSVQIPMDTPLLRIPALSQGSRVRGSLYGGVRSYWKRDGAGATTTSQPTTTEIKLETDLLITIIPVTDTMMQSQSSLGMLLEMAVTDSVQYELEGAILAGDAGSYVGVIGGPSTVNQAAESGQGATVLLTENIDKMWQSLHPRAAPNAVWFIHQFMKSHLLGLEHAVGTGGVPVYRRPDGVASAPNGTLFGLPVYVSEHCSTPGTSGDIVLFGSGCYYVGLLGSGTEFATSAHLYFDRNEQAFRWTHQSAGAPCIQSTITLADGSNTVGIAVTLATRS